MTPFGLLPYAALGLLILLLRRRFPGRPAVPAAAVAWAVFLIVVTELTSAFSAFTFRCVLVAWTLGSAVVLALLFAGGAPAAPSLRPPLIAGLQLQRAAVVSLALLAGLVALWAPPNNSDTMVYHMSRVCHWIQNHTIAPYPTHILRQLHQNPWSDWAVAHLQLLAGGDRLANTVQWLSMMGSLSVAGTVAGQLGGDRRAQVLAAVLCATIPMGVIEASTAKNDYVAAFWLLCFVHFLLRIRQAPDDRGRGDAFLAGGALGLAVLTKATCYLFALPFMLWLLSPLRSRLPWKAGVLVAGTALLLNTGHYWRNYEVYGRALGADREGPHVYANDALTLRLLFSNVIRNVSLHLDTRVPTLNRLTARAIVRAHRILGIDPSDPRITWLGITFDGPRERTDADTAGNLWHLLLAIAALVLVLASPSPARLRAYACALAGTFLLFCAYLKWQPWHSRLHLPVFVLACPLIVAVLCARLGARTTAAVSAALVLWALPPMLTNEARPLLGAESVLRVPRETQYFRTWPDLELPYRKATRVLKAMGCSRLGLYKDVVWEYPLWPLLRAQTGRVRIEHIGVENASAPLASREPFESFAPCAIVSFQPGAGSSLRVGAATYKRSWSSGGMSLFTESRARRSASPAAPDRP